jgi:hypothetical protein
MKSQTRFLCRLGAVLCLLTVAAASIARAADEDALCNAAAKAGRGRITVTSDAPCKLTVNGEPQGALAASQPRTVEGGGEKRVIRCASTEVPGAATEEVSLTQGCGSVTFEVAAAWHRFSAAKDGGVRDADSGLSWLAADNGGDVDWAGAGKYCAAKGGRLPSDKELRALHTEGAVRTRCGEFTCMMSHLFHLSGRFFWTSTPFEPDQAVAIGMAGQRPAVQSVKRSMAKDARALCVLPGP